MNAVLDSVFDWVVNSVRRKIFRPRSFPHGKIFLLVCGTGSAFEPRLELDSGSAKTSAHSAV
jgi:hypothetical protein